MKTIYATVDHPQTVLNPDIYFKVVDWDVSGGKLIFRGENTCWFNVSMATFHNEKDALELIQELQARDTSTND